MAYNKFIKKDGTVFLDLTDTSVSAETLVEGVTAVDKSGTKITGTLVVTEEPVLQEKTATENGEVTADEGFDGLSKVIVDVAGGGGGECDLPHIIEVDVLPTENISETDVYLCDGKYYKYRGGEYSVTICGEGQNLEEMMPEQAAPYLFETILMEQGFSVKAYHFAETFPTEDIAVSVIPELEVYYIQSENGLFAYAIVGEQLAWIPFEELSFPLPFVGAIYNPSESTDMGYYFLNAKGFVVYQQAPTEDILITENGAYNVTDFASAKVMVPTIYTAQNVSDLQADATIGSLAYVLKG